ncbi:possible Rhomboid family [Prochlorococcus marinus str. MIT 9515]|uniref:Possible Rhomboid family n=1 Tax=Prochlorococcus marinus (strain MIT 9515) TaxID=167542 RepID=A2BUW2_PROM5|nr:possible Rhomboid family [Prochlorococcus marinus str. MIT 9515]
MLFNNNIIKSFFILRNIKKEAQFIIPSCLCFLLFIVVNLTHFYLVSDLSYWSSYIINQPYRILSYSFVHKDINHLLSNLFGIIVVRYCFINLKLKNIFLFLYLIILLIPIQTFLLFMMDSFLFYERNRALVGFSGIIFGTVSFILLSSLYGKQYIFNIFIGLNKNNEIYRLTTVFLSLGVVYSFLPSISLSGHIAGILSGFIIFIF